MRISPIGPNNPVNSVTSTSGASNKTQVSGSGDGISFKETVKKAIGQVNELQHQADQMAVGLASGNVEDVHEAMLAMQKAKLALDLTIQVRNKVIEAYQEIMRMQV